MRIRTGHGSDDWTPNTPGAYARVPGHSGSLVTGERGPVQRHREAAHKKTPEQAAAAYERTKRYRDRLRCDLHGRCRHRPCIDVRVQEARRLFAMNTMTLDEIGCVLGGRDHSTISYWLNEYRDKSA